MRADSEEFKSGRPKIVQEDIEGGDAVVVTISAVEREKVKGDDGDKTLLVLLTEEFGDKVHRLNASQRKYLIEQLGAETDAWVGERVPLVKTRKDFAGKTHATVWVAPPELWATIFAAAGLGPKRSPKAAVPAQKTTKRK